MKKMKKKLKYLVNKFILTPPYHLWVWIGNQKWWFDMTLHQRNKHMEDLKTDLKKIFKDNFRKMEKMNPDSTKDLIV